MSESALKRLRQESRKEVGKKPKAFKKEQIEKERAEEVWLTRAIYVELFVSRTHIAKEINFFEQE